MLNRIIRIFIKDSKIAFRDAIIIYMIIVPILLSIGILLLIPSISDMSIKIAVLQSEDEKYLEYLEKFAQLEKFDNIEELERRVLKKDNIIGMVSKDNSHQIIAEGNEDPVTTDFAKLLNRQYEQGATKENSTAKIYSFKKTVNPIKTKLSNMLILVVVMISGMIISLGIIEEKSDNTISAINVSPVSNGEFIIGKCFFGGFAAFGCIIISLNILGYSDINWLMIMLIAFLSFVLSSLVGFLQGINSSDVIEAASGIKLMMFPGAVSIAGYELLSDKWQWTMYWSPFYWAYKANDLILSKKAIWEEIMICAGFVLAICIILYIIFIPGIRKKLSKV